MKKNRFRTIAPGEERKLLQAEIENEVRDYIQFHKDRRDENGQRLVVRNGLDEERPCVLVLIGATEDASEELEKFLPPNRCA
jgi:hypothetical protein